MAKWINCKSCGHRYYSDIERCPECGRRSPANPKQLAIAGVITAVCTFSLVGVILGMQDHGLTTADVSSVASENMQDVLSKFDELKNSSQDTSTEDNPSSSEASSSSPSSTPSSSVVSSSKPSSSVTPSSSAPSSSSSASSEETPEYLAPELKNEDPEGYVRVSGYNVYISYPDYFGKMVFEGAEPSLTADMQAAGFTAIEAHSDGSFTLTISVKDYMTYLEKYRVNVESVFDAILTDPTVEALNLGKGYSTVDIRFNYTEATDDDITGGVVTALLITELQVIDPTISTGCVMTLNYRDSDTPIEMHFPTLFIIS